MKRRKFMGSLMGAGVVAASGLRDRSESIAEAASGKRPNILWLIFDDGRRDGIGCYGRPWVRTPNMDRIALSGVVFRDAVVQNPVCVPSRTSMLSGLYPHTTRSIAMGSPSEIPPDYIPEGPERYPNLLDAWKNAGIIPLNVGKRHGYDRDIESLGEAPPKFNVYGKPAAPLAVERMKTAKYPYPAVVTKTHGWAIGGISPLRPEETNDWEIGTLAVKALNDLTVKDDPFFLRVSFSTPHVPCRVPEEYFIDPAGIDLPLPTEAELGSKSRFERDQLRVYSGSLDLNRDQIDISRGTYYGMMTLADVQVGRILDVLEKSGKLDNTIIAINSDQGFLLGEHGMWKKRCLYDINVCAPLILSCPGLLPVGQVIEEPVEMIDFLPTLMNLSGFEAPRTISGRSLVPLIRREVTTWREACFCEIDHSQSMYDELRGNSGRRVMVRTKEWKLEYFMDSRVSDKDGALYDLLHDPDERMNVIDKPEHRDVVRYLEGLAESWARTSEG